MNFIEEVGLVLARRVYPPSVDWREQRRLKMDREVNIALEMGTGGQYQPFIDRDRQGVLTAREYEVISPENQLLLLALNPNRVSGLEILNCGAGRAPLGSVLSKKGALAIDLDVAYGQDIHPSKDSVSVRANAESLPYSDAKFDEVLLCNILELVDNPLKAIREAWRVMADGGYLRIHPVVAFKDLRKVQRPGIVAIRMGMDDFTLVVKKTGSFLDGLMDILQGEVVCIKPGVGFPEKRANGYYYRSESKDDRWYGDL